MLSTSPLVPQTMLSTSIADAVPQTMLSSSPSATLVPQTMLSQSAPPHSVPHTMLSHSARAAGRAPHDVVGLAVSCPRRCCRLRGRPVPQTMLSASSTERCPTRCCRTRWSRRSCPTRCCRLTVFASRPRDVRSAQALPAGLMTPRSAVVAPEDGLAPRRAGRVRWPACGAVEELREVDRALRVQEAGALRSAGRSRTSCAVYWMIAFTRFGVSFGFACSISATVPATTGAAMLVPVRLRYGL